MGCGKKQDLHWGGDEKKRNMKNETCCSNHLREQDFIQELVVKNPSGILPLAAARNVEKSKRLFATPGKKAVFFGRFLMGLRAPLFLVAGITRFPFKNFFIMDLTAAIISVPLLFYLSFYFGSHIEYALDILSSVQKIIFFVVLIIVFYIFWKGFKFIKKKTK